MSMEAAAILRRIYCNLDVECEQGDKQEAALKDKRGKRPLHGAAEKGQLPQPSDHVLTVLKAGE